MNWDKRYEIDVAFIDNQHREWFTRVVKLGEAIDHGETNAEMASALKFVVDYTQKHFADEEAYMRENHYPDLASQKKLHKDFEKYIVDVLINLKRGNEVPPVQLYEFMSNWMKQHIQEEDRRMGMFLSRAGRGDVPGADAGEEDRDPFALKLGDLAGLYESELITEADFESKKKEMLRQFATDPSAKPSTDVMSKLEKLKALIGEGLLTEDDLNIGREALTHAVNVAKELARRDGYKAKMVHLKNLLDEEVITEEHFETHKAEILSQM